MSLAAPASRAKTLAPEAALAARILRAPHVPSEYVKWLAAPQLADSNPPTHRGLAPPAAVTASIAEILQPLVADAGPQQQAEAQRSAVWLGAISHFSVAQSRSLGLGMGMRKLSACLLPLYRTLATGKLREGLQQTRCRLLELLALLALCQEMGDDLVNLLESSQSSNADPDGRLKELFAVDLVDLAELLRLQLLDTDEAGDAPSPGAGQAQWLFNPPAARTALADWCEPQLLWRLAGELLSRNSEFVLPRAWADTPVPWSRIADHWNALAHLLTAAPAERERQPSNWLSFSARATESYSDEPAAAEGAASPAAAAKRRQRKDGPRIDTVEQNGEEQDRAAREGSATAADPVLKANQDADQQDADQDRRTRAVGPEVDSAPAAPWPATAAALPGPTTLNPKVLIAEIHTHNDPVFVNVVRRQIAVCRSEARALSLACIVVRPEDEADRLALCGSRDNGLALWQQKMVQWLAEHPQVVEPYAFLTTEGELVLCLLDLERSETTSLLRHGLLEVLLGRPVDDDSGTSLAKVSLPARYHAGIATSSSPGASLSPQQLIEAAVRCLTAARSLGKGSMKSIEVY